MGLNITTLPVITKDLPISPRFTPYEFLSHVSSALLQLVNQWLRFVLTHVLTLSAKEEKTQILVTRIELTTSALAGVQVTYLLL